MVAYLTAGSIREKSGPGGRDVLEATAGDLVHIDPDTVHREGYGTDQVSSIGFSSDRFPSAWTWKGLRRESADLVSPAGPSRCRGVAPKAAAAEGGWGGNPIRSSEPGP